jgi:hypothetical protein
MTTLALTALVAVGFVVGTLWQAAKPTPWAWPVAWRRTKRIIREVAARNTWRFYL